MRRRMNTAVPNLRAARAPLPLIAVIAVLAAVLLWFVIPRYHYASDYSIASYTDY